MNRRRLWQGVIPPIKLLGNWLPLVFASLSLLVSAPVQGAQPVSLDSPIGFFTNVASRLLRSELNIELNRIQIYPTNQYTPSVHRLLQVTANVYDAATNRPISDYPFVPSVFRPLFTNDSGAIYICGYAEETGTNLLNATMRDVMNSADRTAIQATDMVYGVPAVVGAKKGWPNFNEFGMQNEIVVSRKLNFHRIAPGASLFTTNQIYTVGISNAFGLEAWNSYSATFSRPLKMCVELGVTMSLTNYAGVPIGPEGLALSNTFSVSAATNIPASSWSGFTSITSAAPFIVPVFANYWFLTNSDYVSSQNAFTGGTDPVNYFQILRLWLNLRTRVRFVLMDMDLNRIVDYVNLDSSENPLELGDLLQQTYTAGYASCDGNFGGEAGSLFCTNRIGIGTQDIPSIPTYGILNQFGISIGSIQVSSGFWRYYNADSNDQTVATAMFRQNIFGLPGAIDFSTSFNPRRTIHHYVWWQANDPLVHHTISDLVDLLSANRNITFDQDNSSSALSGIGGAVPLNAHYRPWGGNPLRSADTVPPTKMAVGLKDPLIRNSDGWSFPTNEYPSLDWIGKVHRGTPWQTLFLKATNVDNLTWGLWTGVTNVPEAQLTMPTNDWHVASLIVSMLNTNNPHNLYSVNQPNPEAWRGVLDGLTVMTNTGVSQFDTLIISSNSPQAEVISNGLDANRASQTNQYFQDVGDILRTPELSMVSPWLNTSSGVNSGITDEAYEKIPAQLLGLLRPDSVGILTKAGAALHVRFTGVDGWAYGVQVSTNLINWTMVSTNYPTNGFFDFIDGRLQKFPNRFCRSVLLP